MRGTAKSLWRTEMVAVWGYVQRNYFLTKRYFMWELVWLTFTTVNAMSITFIGAGVEQVGGGEGTDTERLMTFLLVGALIWSYLSMIFDVLSETVQWERWEGTIEYTFMSPTSSSAATRRTGAPRRWRRRSCPRPATRSKRPARKESRRCRTCSSPGG